MLHADAPAEDGRARVADECIRSDASNHWGLHVNNYRATRRYVCALAMAIPILIALACGNGGDGREVTEEEFGEDWPFTVASGSVDCNNLSNGLRVAVFRSGSVTYALNGTATARAEDQGYEDVMKIWRDDPDYEGLKINIGPILDLALGECD